MSEPQSGRAFRFGVSIWGASSAGEWRAKARKAEDLGFDVLLVPDHLADIFPPLTALTSAADATSSLHVGTYVLNNDFRNPALLAREAATLALLTDGRFELGIGAGHMESEYVAAGLPFDPAPMRVARLTESVDILQRLLVGEELTFEGEHYRVRNHRIYPAVTVPMPLLIGGNGRRVLELAALRADIVSFTGFFPADGGRRSDLTHFTAAGLEDRLAIVRAAAGARFDRIELNCLVQAVLPGDTPATALGPMLARTPGLSLDEALHSPFLLSGPPEAMAEALLARRDRFGITYISVFEPAMDALASVIAHLK
ncbi:MAG TPA: TIGR03621 family F420-dependent LLM class oxidoreductase [Gemmatimonadales bacterium]|nr:TIGR03621 family F420-dependent LLM class oxidoreductase [Gemmatimonadales bacterium]